MKKVTKQQMAELKALVKKKEKDIDTSELPEIKDFRKAVVGKFYRPMKHPITIRIDADVLAWFKEHYSTYQRVVNKVLREYMGAHQ